MPPRGAAAARPFEHPSSLHPYAALCRAATPIRWVLYVITAVMAWGGVVPAVALLHLVRVVARRLLAVADRCIAPEVEVDGGCGTDARFHSVAPADLMWLDRTDRGARVGGGGSSASPGTAACNLIHAVLVFDRRVSLAALRSAFARRILSRPAFGRFKWRAVRRVVRRWWLPSWAGGVSDSCMWLQPHHEHDFDLTRHIRVIPREEWAEFALPNDAGRSQRVQVQRESRMLPRPRGDEEAEDSSTFESLNPPHHTDASHDHAETLRMAHLQAYLSHLSDQPLTPHQPLWELLLLESAQSPPHSTDHDPSVEHADDCIVVFRCSHALADGVLLSGIILKSFLQEEGGGGDAPPLGDDLPTPSPDQPKESPSASPEASTVRIDLRTSDEPLPRPITRPSKRGPSRPLHKRLLLALRDIYNWLLFFLTGPYLLLHKSFQPDDENILHAAPSSGVGGGATASSGVVASRKDICWSVAPFPLDRVKRVSRHLGVTLNDLVMNLWLDVLDEYLIAAESTLAARQQRRQRHPDNVDSAAPLTLPARLRAPSSMFIIVPFNVRTAVELDFERGAVELGNRFAVLMVDVPMGRAIRPSSAAEGTTRRPAPTSTPFMRRLDYLSRYLTHLKTYSCESRLMYASLAFLLACTPRSWSRFLLDIYADLCSVVITNNRSPPVPLFLDETDREHEKVRGESRHATDRIAVRSPISTPARLKYWVSWAPQRNHAGVCVTLLTYAGQLRVSIVADARCLRHTTSTRLVQRYEEKLAQLVREVDEDEAAERERVDDAAAMELL